MSIVIGERSIDINKGDQKGVIFRIINGEYVVHSFYKEWDKDAKEYRTCDYHNGFFSKNQNAAQSVYIKRRNRLLNAAQRRRNS